MGGDKFANHSAKAPLLEGEMTVSAEAPGWRRLATYIWAKRHPLLPPPSRGRFSPLVGQRMWPRQPGSTSPSDGGGWEGVGSLR